MVAFHDETNNLSGPLRIVKRPTSVALCNTVETPRMLCLPHPPEPIIQNWLDRHRHPASFALHMVGIPATIFGALLTPIYLPLASWSIFLLSMALFFGGYLIQFLGHWIERSEPGELIVLRRILNRRGWVAVPAAAPAKSGHGVV